MGYIWYLEGSLKRNNCWVWQKVKHKGNSMCWAQGHGVLFVITFNPLNNLARRRICVYVTERRPALRNWTCPWPNNY